MLKALLSDSFWKAENTDVNSALRNLDDANNYHPIISYAAFSNMFPCRKLIVVFRAFAKLTNKELAFENSVKLRGDIAQVEQKLRQSLTAQYPTNNLIIIRSISIAPSTFERSVIQKCFTEGYRFHKNLNDDIQRRTDKLCLGIAFKNNQVILIKNSQTYSACHYHELTAACLAMTALRDLWNPEAAEKEYRFIQSIIHFTRTTTFDKFPSPWDSPTNVPLTVTTKDNVLMSIIRDYVEQSEEYKVDNTQRINDFIDTIYSAQENNLIACINNAKLKLNNLRQQISDVFTQLDSWNRELSIRTQTKEHTREIVEQLMDMFERYKTITDYQFDSHGKISIMTVQPLYINDVEDGWKVIRDRAQITSDQRKFLDKLFIDEAFGLLTYAKIELDIIKNKIYQHSFNSVYTEAIPHPHIEGYDCFGTYYSLITDYIASGEYVAAVEQAISAAGSLNWSDATVMNHFYRDLTKYANNRCVIYKDGTTHTILEVINEINEQA